MDSYPLGGRRRAPFAPSAPPRPAAAHGAERCEHVDVSWGAVVCAQGGRDGIWGAEGRDFQHVQTGVCSSRVRYVWFSGAQDTFFNTA